MAYCVLGHAYKHVNHVGNADLERRVMETRRAMEWAQEEYKQAVKALEAWWLVHARDHLCVVDKRVDTSSERGY